MLQYFIEKALGKRSFVKPTIAVCVPSSVTEVEKRAVEDATRQAGARRLHIIEEPIAAAIGSGIDISRACGSMVVDIGGGTTDIAVISLGGTVVSYSLKIAGDNFDDAIIRYMRKKHNVLIGECWKRWKNLWKPLRKQFTVYWKKPLPNWQRIFMKEVLL